MGRESIVGHSASGLLDHAWSAEEHEQHAREWEALQVETGEILAPGTAIVSALDVVGWSIDDACAGQVDANRAAAKQVFALDTAIQVARSNPHVYLRPAGLGERDALELAERAAAQDVAFRLHLSPAQVRTQAWLGRTLIERLPRLGGLFREGTTTLAHVTAAGDLLVGLTDPAAIAQYDAGLAAIAPDTTPAAFRAKARLLHDRPLTEPAELRHARAMAKRRVELEPDTDGMAWIHAYVSAVDGIRIMSRLDATAKSIAKQEKGDPRSRMQIRTDLFTAWLAGDGTPTAAKVRPFLFVPLLSLIGRTDQPAILHGYGPIDPVTAAQLFSDAPAFRRIGTDPFTGEVLDYDRTRYRPTQAQRDWLAIKHGTCGCPDCDRLAVGADVDHLEEWYRDNGLTNQENLIPLSADHHRLKTLTKIRFARGPDGTITVTTPTGYTGIKKPARPLGDDPPF